MEDEEPGDRNPEAEVEDTRREWFRNEEEDWHSDWGGAEEEPWAEDMAEHDALPPSAAVTWRSGAQDEDISFGTEDRLQPEQGGRKTRSRGTASKSKKDKRRKGRDWDRD